jgi:hypothetical protein
MVWFVWSNTALMISGSGIRFIVRLATMLLIRLLSLRVNLDVLVYSPFRKINFHGLGRYFSINSVNFSNENGFLNISFIPEFFNCSKTFASDEAVKITMFFSISSSLVNDWITSWPLNSGMAKSNKIRSKFSLRILSNPSLPLLITLQSISFSVPQ